MPHSNSTYDSHDAEGPGHSSTPRSRNGEGARTRGGWTPAGTAAKRRENYSRQGTPRGQKARQEILFAARRVFERDGYIDVNVDDIVKEADVSRGSFYTYFPSKLDAFQALSSELGGQIDEAVVYRMESEPIGPTRDLRESHRRYIDVYRTYAQFYGLIEQVATIDEETRELRRSGRQRHIDRVARRIRVWQDRGSADPILDAESTAAALVSMTSNQCYWWFVGGENRDVGREHEVITDIWVRVLGLHDEPRP